MKRSYAHQRLRYSAWILTLMFAAIGGNTAFIHAGPPATPGNGNSQTPKQNDVALQALALLHAGPSLIPGLGNDPILKWNSIALEAVAEDHSGTFGPADQGGPTRTSRALAIVHIAMYDAANAILGGYEPYLPVTGIPAAKLKKASIHAAVAQAAHDTLMALYPSQSSVFSRELRRAILLVPPKKGRTEGILVGAKAAANILSERLNDGGDDPNVPFAPSDVKVIGAHQPDPLNPNQGLLTPFWGAVTPFAMDDVLNFNVPPPPMPDSSDEFERLEYALNYEEVLRLGGDGIITPTDRTREQTEIGLFWAYDGAIGLGTPPRLYNQIARVIAWQQRNSVMENARLFALINISMADAGIASWYSKYLYNFWRPIIAIHCGEDDGNEFTVGDVEWTPLGAPATNGSNGGINFTPPFPAYTSGHATFGAALFRTLAHLYGDDQSFWIRSDELSPGTTDDQGRRRPLRIRHFESFSEAAQENADSRIYLGIHWGFDADQGIIMGNQVADYAVANYLTPVN